MEKELKSCTGVLLRADLTGYGHPSPFWQNRWDGHTLLGQPSKGHPCRILILFPQCSTALLAPHIKKLETYFALLYFWTFAQCSVLATTSLKQIDFFKVCLFNLRWNQSPFWFFSDCNYSNCRLDKNRKEGLTGLTITTSDPPFKTLLHWTIKHKITSRRVPLNWNAEMSTMDISMRRK